LASPARRDRAATLEPVVRIFDLSIMTSGDADAIRTVAKGGGGVAVRLRSFPKPPVAACTGQAVTIGAMLGSWLSDVDRE
jgi:enoyl-CoA hydratase/carnithine racemase